MDGDNQLSHSQFNKKLVIFSSLPFDLEMLVPFHLWVDMPGESSETLSVKEGKWALHTESQAPISLLFHVFLPNSTMSN